MNNDLYTRCWNTRFTARCRDIYNGKRTMFWTGLEMFAQLGEFILSTAAFLALTRDHATFGTWTTFTVSILSFLALWLGAGKRARKCAELSKEYALLRADVSPYPEWQTEECANAAAKRLAEIEAMENGGLECLAIICHNDACFEAGVKPQWRLNWIERTIGRFLPIPYTPKAARDRDEKETDNA